MKNAHCRTLYMVRELKNVKMRNAQYRVWNMVIKLENEKKMRISHDRTWNMVRNTEKGGK